MTRARHYRTWTVLLLAACAEQECTVNFTDPFTFGGLSPSPPTLSLSPGMARILVTDTVRLDAMATDSWGLGSSALDPAAVVWSSGAPAVARVVRPGLLVAAGLGTAIVTATWAATSDRPELVASATVEVLPLTALTLMSVVPERDTLVPDEVLQYAVRAQDATGRDITLWPRWSSTSDATASVSARGLVTGGQVGEARIIATAVTGRRAEAPVTITAPRHFASLEAGLWFSCGVDIEARVYCWGDNAVGQLGSGAPGAPMFARPVEVAGGQLYAMVSVGTTHACALTTDGRILCWGRNEFGELGDGTTVTRSMPAEIRGDGRFIAVSVGNAHSCGLEVAGAVSCWGDARMGQLGIETPDSLAHPIPTRVAGDVTFASVTAGAVHTCALTEEGAAYCWGQNDRGQVGVDSAADLCTVYYPSACVLTPVAVRGGVTFTTLSAGGTHTCGLTADGDAYCWGSNFTGQLGVSMPSCQSTPWCSAPGRVSGSLRFATLAAGGGHTCASALDGTPYCWGDNDHQQVGVPSTNFGESRYEPQRVSGNKIFPRVAAGTTHSCGIAPSGAAYCWGANDRGQLGSRVMWTSATPVPVRR